MAPRKNTRRNRKNMRRNRKATRRNRKQAGGNPSPVGMYDLGSGSLSQGQEFAAKHVGQHGGSSPVLGGPYPGSGEPLLNESMASAAKVGALNASLNEIKGMQDGGRRSSRKSRKSGKKSRKQTRKNRKSRKSSKKSRKSRKSRKSSKKSRKYSGGAVVLTGAPTNADGLLLPVSVTAAGMNPEWKLASNPTAFAPSK